MTLFKFVKKYITAEKKMLYVTYIKEFVQILDLNEIRLYLEISTFA